jgi:hypothetical protein
MIQNKSLASEIHALMLEIGGRINESAAAVRGQCGPDEFDRYQRACAMILMDILMEVVNPIQEAHPEIGPHEQVSAKSWSA